MKRARPGDPGYDDDRRISNARFDYKPNPILYCESETDVVEALRYARAAKLPMRVRAGGHQHEGMCSGNGVLMLDVSSLDKIEVDTRTYRMRVGPGAKLGDIYKAVLSKGLLFPGGACEDVHVGGLVQGGGWGLFARTLGLCCDWLHGFRMVVPRLDKPLREDFHVIEAKGDFDDPNFDLYWAVSGGGGGNFGVATEYEFGTASFNREPGQVKSVTQFTATYSERSVIGAVMRGWMEAFPGYPDERLTTFCRVIAPGTENIDKPALILGNFVGEELELRTVLNKLLPRPSTPDVTYKTIAVWPPPPSPAPSVFTHPMYQAGPPQDLGNTCGGASLRHKVSSAYPRSDGRDAIDTIVKHVNATSLANARRYVSLHSLGGAVRDNGRDEYSCFAYRDKPFLLQYQAWWMGTELDPLCLRWIADIRDDMYGRGYTEGSFINFPDRDLVRTTDRRKLMAPYYGKSFDRLMHIKKVRDPLNVFDFEMGIPLS